MPVDGVFGMDRCSAPERRADAAAWGGGIPSGQTPCSGRESVTRWLSAMRRGRSRGRGERRLRQLGHHTAYAPDLQPFARLSWRSVLE